MLVSRLPFRLDDAASVGELFDLIARKRHGRQDEYHLDLWTYCFVRRFFLVRFIRSAHAYTGADLEAVIEQAFGRIERNRNRVREPLRYAQWVTVLCRNTYLNFVSRQRVRIPVDRIAEPGTVEGDTSDWHDEAIRAHALDAAIGRLPRFLRAVATFKLVQSLDYEVISEKTGLPVASCRAYAHKALVRLRNDKRLLSVLGYELAADGSNEL